MAWDKFIPELHLKQPGFIYSAFGPFPKHRKRIKKFRETRKSKDLCKNELKNLVLLIMQHILIVKIQQKRNISDKILKDRAYEISTSRGHNGYRRDLSYHKYDGLASMVYKFFHKKTGSGVSVSN